MVSGVAEHTGGVLAIFPAVIIIGQISFDCCFLVYDLIGKICVGLTLFALPRVHGSPEALLARNQTAIDEVAAMLPANANEAGFPALLTSLAPGENVDLTYDIEQGMEMGRPSRIVATAAKTAEGPVSPPFAGPPTCLGRLTKMLPIRERSCTPHSLL